jgi:hypothetical protein
MSSIVAIDLEPSPAVLCDDSRRTKMIWIRSLLAGVAAALVALVIFVAVSFLPLAGVVLMSRTTGSGGIGAVSVGSGPALLVALLAFAGGFYWQFRRASRPRPKAR